MVHPTGVAGAERLKSYYLVNLIGNPSTQPLRRQRWCSAA
jgi:hypothetical protein